MTRKLPTDSFDVYVSLGPSRSYSAVAAKFGVTKRAVTKLATREGWQARLAQLEAKARERSDTKIVETLESMNGRHLKMLQVIQGKALEALRAFPLRDAMTAVRSLDMAIRQERTIRGEPGDRTAVAIEDVIRGEYQRWMTAPAEPTTAAVAVELPPADGEDDDDGP